MNQKHQVIHLTTCGKRRVIYECGSMVLALEMAAKNPCSTEGIPVTFVVSREKVSNEKET